MHENVSDQKEQDQQLEKRRSRRQLLGKGLVAATAAIGAGALLEQSRASAHSDMPDDNVGNFSSSNSSVPAVTATGTNGAVGVSSGSDTADGIYSTSNGPGKSGVFGYNSTSTGFGLYGEADTGIAVNGGTTSGIAVRGTGGTSGIAVQAIGGSVALNVQGTVQVQGNSVGQATLAAGKTSVTVTTSAATASSNILLTPLGNPGGNLWVVRASGSFTIHASKAPSANLSIAYLIIN